MSIIIRDLLSEDIIGASGNFTSFINKINFNFDQVLINGGGPIGLQGNTGPQGIPGAIGKRGNLWFAGNTGPTQSYDGGVLITGDQYINSSGDIISYYSGGTGWTGTGINLRGPKGSTGASGANGSVAGFNLYKGGTGVPYGITLGDDSVVLKPTGATGEDTLYTNYPAIENRKNSFFIGNIGWASSYLKNFGITYNEVIPGWVGFSEFSHKPPKAIFIQDQVDDISSMLISFGAYGLTSTNTVSTYGWDWLGSTANTDFLDFINLGFTNEQSDSPATNKTKFKLHSRKIPVHFKIGGIDSVKGETAADFTISANTVKINSYGATGLVISTNTQLTGSIVSQLNITGSNFLSVGHSTKPSSSTYSIFASNSGDISKGGIQALNYNTAVNKIAIFANDLSSTTGSTSIYAYSSRGIPLHLYPALGTTALFVERGIADTQHLHVRNDLTVLGGAIFSGTAGVTVSSDLLVSSGLSTYTLNASGLAVLNGGISSNYASINTLYIRSTSTFDGLATFVGGLTASNIYTNDILSNKYTLTNFTKDDWGTILAAVEDNNTLNIDPDAWFGSVKIGSPENASSLKVTGNLIVDLISTFNTGLTAKSIYASNGLTAINLTATGATVTGFNNTPVFNKGFTTTGATFSGTLYFTHGATFSGTPYFTNGATFSGSSAVFIDGFKTSKVMYTIGSTSIGIDGAYTYGFSETRNYSFNYLNLDPISGTTSLSRAIIKVYQPVKDTPGSMGYIQIRTNWNGTTQYATIQFYSYNGGTLVSTVNITISGTSTHLYKMFAINSSESIVNTIQA